MNELIVYTIIIAIWFSLQLWVFPKLGIPSCLGGQCNVPVKKPKEDPHNLHGELKESDG